MLLFIYLSATKPPPTKKGICVAAKASHCNIPNVAIKTTAKM